MSKDRALSLLVFLVPENLHREVWLSHQTDPLNEGKRPNNFYHSLSSTVSLNYSGTLCLLGPSEVGFFLRFKISILLSLFIPPIRRFPREIIDNTSFHLCEGTDFHNLKVYKFISNWIKAGVSTDVGRG